MTSHTEAAEILRLHAMKAAGCLIYAGQIEPAKWPYFYGIWIDDLNGPPEICSAAKFNTMRSASNWLAERNLL